MLGFILEFFKIGFMMFVDENQMMGGQFRNPPPRPPPYN